MTDFVKMIDLLMTDNNDEEGSNDEILDDEISEELLPEAFFNQENISHEN